MKAFNIKSFIITGAVATVVFFTCLLASVQATSFVWSYIWKSGGVISGTLAGEIDMSDSNRITVSSIMGRYQPKVGFRRDFSTQDIFPNTLTLDGKGNDFTAREFIFGGTILRALQFLSGPGPGSDTAVFQEAIGIMNPRVTVFESETFDRSSWAVTPITSEPIPEPSTLLLFGTGMLGLLAWARRKKQSAT